MKPFIIKFQRKYQKEVEELISKCLFEIFGEHELQKFENFNLYLEQGGLFLIMIDKDKVIGVCGLTKEGIVKRLYVLKKYRNRGIAQRLYDGTEEFAKTNGFKKLRLSTTLQMKSAIAFYEKNGFVKIGINKKTNQVFFEKELK